MSIWGIRVLLCGIASVSSLVCAEIVLRRFGPQEAFGAGVEWDQFRLNPDTRSEFVVGQELGYRPMLRNGLYSVYGTLVNDYPMRKRPGVARVLFLGDSATVRGKIIAQIRAVYGDQAFEYWNAGEVRFFERYNWMIGPDHVVLTFHMSDLGTTPIATVTHGQRMVVLQPYRPIRYVNRWLFTHSHLYRLLIGIIEQPARSWDLSVQETIDSLRRLQQQLERRNIQLTVLVLPLLEDYARWPNWAKQTREEILRFLQEAGIRYFDLLEPLEQAINDRVETTDPAGDTWHPSEAVSRYFAAYLQTQGLFHATSR